MGTWTLIPYKTLKGTLTGILKGTFKGILKRTLYGWLSKSGSLFGYPKYWVPYYIRDPKKDHNFDNHPYEHMEPQGNIIYGFGPIL